VAVGGDFFEGSPERILKADTRFVVSNDDRALDDQRFHGTSPTGIPADIKAIPAHMET
jgi:hypothetical protein